MTGAGCGGGGGRRPHRLGDVIFVMERSHPAKLNRRFRDRLRGKRVVCLDIPDDYGFMQPELVALLEQRVGRHL
ncbi:MAG: hypothetical protein KF910_00835 [Brevundimonas sp.]|uniref:hypothetical protein n=1 Tax=Brevundimonas sp. TaxID=1871086 RepID=UPI0025BC6A92|nr:hypothetical protein [Brevundimonas sp.]MBX3476133.1 hypothetical protein [Brevundimonas sp.]